MSEKTTVFIYNKFYEVSKGDEILVEDYWVAVGTQFSFVTFTSESVKAVAVDQNGLGSILQIVDIIREDEEPVACDVEETPEEVYEELPDFDVMTKAELVTYIKDSNLEIDVNKKNKATILEEIKSYYN